ncbi:MAG: SPOR domain-containing protein [Sphingosinicella sp.]
MNRTAFKIAASTMIVSMATFGSTAQSEAIRRMAPTAQIAQSDRDAARSAGQARRLLRQGRPAQSLQALENAVALAPRDAGYRLQLADFYMRSGRFESARATFADALELDPSSLRAGMSLALMHIALGRPQAALGQLASLEGRAPPADIGLAYALAGQPERAIQILEPAARAFDATPRLRQNLALSYALAGNWERARTVAAQDVSPADLGPRLQQWATLTRPGASSGHVASLLGVSPAHDPGQPVRLALNPVHSAPEPVALAQAEAPSSPAESSSTPMAAYQPPVSEPVSGPAPEAPAPAPAPVEMVEAPSYYLPPAPAQAPEPSPAEVRYAAAAETLTRPAPEIVSRPARSLPAPVFRRAAQRPAPVRQIAQAVARGASRFVVQIGAFLSEANAVRAWQNAERRYDLSDRPPLTATVESNGRTLHRVAFAGFASRDAAARQCSQIRSDGGVCFVRSQAGDATVRWAARYVQQRNRHV